MNSLESFTEEEVALLVSLPYKVGIWISNIDDIEGERDDVREMKALEQCLRHISRSHHDKPLIQEIIGQTLEQKDLWPGWADQSFNILPEARQAVSILKAKNMESSARNLRRALLEIGATVARAASEFAAYEDEKKNEGIWGQMIDKAFSAFSGLSEDDPGHPVNVSASEDSALSQLSSALSLKEKAS